jgi:Rrf2 family iron-sulfur cluster assembly transcriptional regulator
MQISSSNYMGVEILVRLAVQNANKPCTTQDLAEWINQSVSHTESLMAQLRKAGLVVSRHGPGGGYTLARPAHQINVAEVFRAFDEPRGLPVRPLNVVTLEPETVQNIHGTDLLWELLKSHILLFLDQISLADIVQQSTGELASDEAEPVAMEPHM